MISINNVYKQFGSQVVLNGINLIIPDGQTTTIVGPSGVGKSVLLKLIMGILTPERGEIYIDDDNITTAGSEAERNRIRERLGVLFQSAALFDSITVYENIAFPLKARTKLSRNEIREEVAAMLQAFGLEQFALKYPQEISMGIRKRVGMARALVMKPKIILFDEPNTGLDPLVGQEVYALINECRKKWGFTGVVISHEIPEVFQVSDRVAMILGGKIIANGTPTELMNSTDLAVRQFILGKTDGPIKIQ